jgi:hypothetical protein
MSYVEYENVGIEESVSEKPGKAQTPLAISVKKVNIQRMKPLAAPGGQMSLGDQVVCRAEEVLNAQLAQGSMPA